MPSSPQQTISRLGSRCPPIGLALQSHLSPRLARSPVLPHSPPRLARSPVLLHSPPRHTCPPAFLHFPPRRAHSPAPPHAPPTARAAPSAAASYPAHSPGISHPPHPANTRGRTRAPCSSESSTAQAGISDRIPSRRVSSAGHSSSSKMTLPHSHASPP